MTRWPHWRAVFGRIRAALQRRPRQPEPARQLRPAEPAEPWTPGYLRAPIRESTAWQRFVGSTRQR